MLAAIQSRYQKLKHQNRRKRKRLAKELEALGQTEELIGFYRDVDKACANDKGEQRRLPSKVKFKRRKQKQAIQALINFQESMGAPKDPYEAFADHSDPLVSWVARVTRTLTKQEARSPDYNWMDWESAIATECQTMRNFGVLGGVFARPEVAHSRPFYNEARLLGAWAAKNAEQDRCKWDARYRCVYGGNDPRRADGSTALYASSASLPASLRDMRLFATAASLHSWDIKAGDVTGAYLNATAPQDSFVTLSEEMIDHLLDPVDAAKYRRIAAEGSKASPKYYPVVELKKALYGHTQAGFLWEAEARKQLLSMGFVNFPDVSSAWYVHYTDPKDGSEPKVDCMLLLYVDDFLIAGNNHACNRIISLMKEIWTLKGGDVHSINDAPIIGTQFTQTFVPDGDDAPLINVGIDQRAYAAHAFAEFQGATGCPEQDLPKRGIDTPIIDGEQNVLLRGPDGKVPPGTWTPGAYAKHAAKIVGILMWLCRTGYFHLTVAVYSVAREVGNWTETVDRQVRRIFAHIRARPDGVLLLRVSPKDLKEEKLKLLEAAERTLDIEQDRIGTERRDLVVMRAQNAIAVPQEQT